MKQWTLHLRAAQRLPSHYTYQGNGNTDVDLATISSPCRDSSYSLSVTQLRPPAGELTLFHHLHSHQEHNLTLDPSHARGL